MNRKITAIVIHHSASAVGTTVNEIDRWHRTRGFSGIGYHWVIRWNGAEYVKEMGRPEHAIGAHCKGHNSDTLGICLCGNFEETEPVMEQLMVAADLVANRCLGYNLPASAVKGHREMAATACPGKHFNLDGFRAMVALELAKIKLLDGPNQACDDGECKI